MQVRCIRAFGYTEPGDVVDVPDGASVSSHYFEPAALEPDPAPDPGPASPSPVPFPAPKEL